MRAALFAGSVVAIVACAAIAEPLQDLAAAPASPYPVAVRLTIAPDALEKHVITDGIFGLPAMLGTPVVEVGRQAAQVYKVAAARMFLPGGKTPAAELAPQVADAGLDLDGEGWFAWVEHEIALRDVATGTDILRWRVRGEGRVTGLGERAIERAFAEAASYAARTFEIDFEQPDAALAWLAAHGVSRGSRIAALPPLPRRFTLKAPPVIAPRADNLFFAEVGGGAGAGGNWASTALVARAGWSGRPWFLQLAIDALPRQFVGQPAAAWGGARGRAMVVSTGMDAGLLRRLGSHFEVTAGVGAALLSGFASAKYLPLDDPTASVEASDTAHAFAADVFAAARFNGVFPLTALRCRAGVELRKAFAGSLSFSAMGGTVDASAFSASLFVGFELPWPRASRP